MEKIKISFDKEESRTTETVKIENQPIEVLTFISLPMQSILIQQYCQELEDISSPIEMRIFRADVKLALTIINFMTNLEIEDIDDYSFPLDDLLASGAYNKILEKITNYKNFKNMLDASVELLFKEKYSKSNMSFRLENIIDKVEKLLEKITSIEVDKDGIAELIKAILNTQKEFNDKYQIIEPSADIAPIVDGLSIKESAAAKKQAVSKKKSG